MVTRHEPHLFACHTVWTGAAKGPTSSYATYSREHEVRIEGKPPLLGSSSPVFGGDAARCNPEDWLVAALSSCHMLSYLALATRAGILVEAYEDHASGVMEKKDGAIRFTSVVLRPKVTIAKDGDIEKARANHEKAHHECFIANSVNFPVTNEPEIVLSNGS